jgi:uncharacterized protein YndB with AHSA1/START domain
MNNPITVQANITAPVEKVWDYFNNPKHIIHWNAAQESWHCPAAKNEVTVGGSFSYTMATRDGRMQFDFIGVYDEVVLLQKLAITLGDDRKMLVTFTINGTTTTITEIFEPENENPIELQQQGWQAILDNFKSYVETN